MDLKISSIDGGKAFDWGKTSAEYAKFRDIYPDEYYNLLVDYGLGISGQNCLDIGTGTGVLPRNMYKYGASWVGADITKEQIEWAKRLSADEGKSIKYVTATAENTGLPANSFDIVTASQCFHYFNKSTALPEIHRVLKNSGHFVVMFMEWLPFESEIAMKSEDLVRKFNPEWSGGFFKRSKTEAPDWLSDMFTCERCCDVFIEVPFTREAWAGRMFSCRGIGAASIDDNKKEKFRTELNDYLSSAPESFKIPHQISVIDVKKR